MDVDDASFSDDINMFYKNELGIYSKKVPDTFSSPKSGDAQVTAWWKAGIP